MQRCSRLFIVAAALSIFVLVSGVLPVLAAPLQRGPALSPCPKTAGKGQMRCFAQIFPDATLAPVGLTPAVIKSVYQFPTLLTAGAGRTIAIVDAYDDPNIAADLDVFSKTFGLPACTAANGCFTKVDQSGGTSYPPADPGWTMEIALDVEWAHAIAPGAQILLVEANSVNIADLMAAEDYARTHAQYVSNSWGGAEYPAESSYDSHFVQPGVSIFFSSGDSGLPAQYPSASPNVISVGGTTLSFNGNKFTGETGWASSGGGCSTYEKAAAAQTAFSSYAKAKCASKRATPDLSLDADLSSGVSVYNSLTYQGQQGWFTIGGTSASTPMIAARAAVAGVMVNAAYLYGKSLTFRDITSGNNGAACRKGYDLVTGRGSWIGATP